MSSERRKLRAGSAQAEESGWKSGYAHYERDGSGVLHLRELCPKGPLLRCDRRDVLHRWWVSPERLAELPRITNRDKS